MSFSSSRKAQVELSLQQLVGIIIAIVVILVSVALFISLMNIFIGPPDSGSQASFFLIYDSIVALYDEHNTNKSCFITPIFVKENWAIAGFNADGVEMADNGITCSMGNDCIEEKCGADDNVKKPYACGRGACICLCNTPGAAGGGDLSGDDCSEESPICRKLPADIPIKQFYMMAGSDECKYFDEGRKTYKRPSGQTLSVCDFVFDSEKCGGDPWGTKLTMILVKQPNIYSSGADFGFDTTEDVKAAYPGLSLTCRQLVNDMKNFRGAAAAPVALPAQQPQGPDVVQQAQQAGAVGRGTDIRANQ